MLKLFFIVSLCAVHYTFSASNASLSVRDLINRKDPAIQMISFNTYVEGVQFKLKPLSLDLSNKGLTSLDGLQNIKDVERIKYVDLSHNKLQDIKSEQIACLINLDTLDLRNNTTLAFNDSVDIYNCTIKGNDYYFIHNTSLLTAVNNCIKEASAEGETSMFLRLSAWKVMPLEQAVLFQYDASYQDPFAHIDLDAID